jgi:outer membrane protein OmpA-like peptidoglycan-associated protein
LERIEIPGRKFMKTRAALLLGPLFLGLSACALMPGQNSSLTTTGPYGEPEEAPTPIPPTTMAAPEAVSPPAAMPTPIPPVAAAPAPQLRHPSVARAPNPPSPPARASTTNPPEPASTGASPSDAAGGNVVYQEISFAKGSAEIPPRTLELLRHTATQLEQMIAQDKDQRVGIVSYTDVAGEGKDASLIGDRRAWRVFAALQADGLPAEKLRVVIPPLKDTTPALAGKVLIRQQPKI